jgi:hypothetical protein
MKYTIKKGCENLKISSTLQGVRLTYVRLVDLSQAQLNELGERFKYPYVEQLQEQEDEKTEPQEQPKKKRKLKPNADA